MTSAAERFEFAPPSTEGLSRALVLAVMAHLLLVAALTLGVQWRRDAPSVEVQAELWSAVPQAAAPSPAPVPPAPAPARAPAPRPAPQAVGRDADIALQRQRAQEQRDKEKLVAQQLERRQLEQRKREQEKLALDKKREQEKLALDKKRELEREAALDKKRTLEQREKDLLAADKKREQEKIAADKKREQQREQALQADEEVARVEAQRQVNLQRMTGMAGASGAAGATGTAPKASGPSGSYGGRVSAIVKPNIVFTEAPLDNPTALVEVRAAPDGTIVGRKLVQSSGNKAWDEAVLKAIDKTAVLPRDVDGSVPPVLEINFRRRD